ncbi:MAG: DMT family transporter [Betaproteobacteria bacterium]|nr:DMT family transporter [Betaproteobacteria bacterium]
MPVEGTAAPARERPFALAALFAGAVAIATAALFVKVSEAGPVSTAFWRVFLAIPFLWAWVLADRGRAAAPADAARERRLMVVAGLFFAGDLAVWHWSIVLTTVATATLLANLAPIFVTLAVWLLLRQRPALRFISGLALAIAGVALLVGGDLQISSEALLGDVLGVITAIFYAAYQLTVTRLRSTTATSRIMAWSSVVMAACLLPAALVSGEQFLPATTAGWAKLLALALIAQVAGQSLIAYAMAHLPPRLSSVGLLLQPVMAALFAWVLLGETLGALQMAGGILVLIGIRIAHQAETGKWAKVTQEVRVKVE